MERLIDLGKHAANGGKAKINRVTLMVSVKDFFSVSGDIWNLKQTDLIQCGQCVGVIAENYAKGNRTVRQLRQLWEVFHLQKMECIPKRFRGVISDFVSGKSSHINFSRERVESFKLEIIEKVTDYGVFTSGNLTVWVAIEEEAEIIKLSEGDEKRHPIVNRAFEALNWLYSRVPTTEELGSNAYIKTNRYEYELSNQKKANDKFAELKTIATEILKEIERVTNDFQNLHVKLKKIIMEA